MMKRLHKFFHRQNGQFLIEAIVTIAVALVIIGSILALVNASNRRATAARQATQASKLAEEGMEIIRNIRDVNGDGLVRVGSGDIDINLICKSGPKFCKWSELYASDQANPTNAYLSFGCVPNQWCLVDTQPASESSLLGIFSRSVVISDDKIDIDGDGSEDAICAAPDSGSDLTLNDVKRVTVTVQWQSPIGLQRREVTSCIANL